MIEIPADIDEYLKKNLSANRYTHTMGVVSCALRLSSRWDVDKSRAYYAALLHDCAKNLKNSELLFQARLHGIAVDEIISENPQLLHADIGAVVARERFGIEDEKILSAIANHTMGKPNMSGLEKVIFLADLIEENRSFEGVYEIRAAAFEELDLGMLMGFESVIKFTLAKNQKLHPRTVAARDYIKSHYCEQAYGDDDDDLFVYGGSIAAQEKSIEPDRNDSLPTDMRQIEQLTEDSPADENERMAFEPCSGKKGETGLKNKTALVTGASGGIGEAVARRFAKEGYNTICCYNTNNCAALAEELNALGQSAEAVKLDISDAKSVTDAVEYISGRYGFIDCLVNCAGISGFELFTDIDESEWEQMLNVNLTGAYRLIREVLPEMIAYKKGAIVNISSMWGQVGSSCEVHYSAAKAGLIGLTKALAKEVGPSGIRVNCVCPGVIETKMNASLSSETLLALAADTPLCRNGKPQEVANAVWFLCSEEASFITGEVLSVSGGYVI